MPTPEGLCWDPDIKIDKTASGRRWTVECTHCGWKPNAPTRATENEAVAVAVWHLRGPLRAEAKRRLTARANGLEIGPSTPLSHPPRTL